MYKKEEEKLRCPTTFKVCYPTAKSAMETIRKIKNYHRGGRNKSIPKRYFKCQFCGYFHLTHLASKQTCKSSLKHIKY